MDEDGYPTEETLEKIKCWPHEDGRGLLEFVKSCWWHRDHYVREEDGFWRLDTVGWSGNEEIVNAMQENITWWVTHWEMSRRGGHHTFSEKP